ncbi:hypothetical protein C9890_0129 [Perkinsus sp. BL_2016]|nr:hypothetical protein C9890_0129 [Perkinsus sp. BL_2016]
MSTSTLLLHVLSLLVPRHSSQQISSFNPICPDPSLNPPYLFKICLIMPLILVNSIPCYCRGLIQVFLPIDKFVEFQSLRNQSMIGLNNRLNPFKGRIGGY